MLLVGRNLNCVVCVWGFVEGAGSRN